MRTRRLVPVLLALGAVAVAPSAASANTLYAAPYRLLKGTATPPCGPEKPCNLAFALSSAGIGDEVVLAPGDYRQPVLVQFLQSGPYTTTLTVKPGVLVHGTAGAAPSVIHARVTANATAAVEVGTGATLRDVRIDATVGDGLLYAYGMSVGTGAVAERVAVTTVGANGTSTSSCTLVGGILRDTACLGTGPDPVVAVQASTSGSATHRLANVTAISTTPGGVGVRTGTANGTATMIATNVIARGTQSDVSASTGLSGGSTTLVLDHSNWNSQNVAAVAGAAAQVVSGPGNQNAGTATPLFVDLAGGDVRQAAGSPTIDAGVTDPFNGALDLDGDPRAVGASTDIGADEFVPPPSPQGGAGGGGGGGTAGGADTVAPSLTALRIARSWRLATGTRARFALSEPATVTLTVLRPVAGRRVRGACRPVTRANRARRHCVLLAGVGRIVVPGAAGGNVVPFSGRLAGGKRLGPGHFRLRASAVDDAGNRGAASSVAFAVVGRR